jgi:pilus assembly protein Flp/PilA
VHLFRHLGSITNSPHASVLVLSISKKNFDNLGFGRQKMRLWINRIWKDTRAQDLVEYALAAGMVALVAVAAMPQLSGTINNVFSRIGSLINSAVA